ncbi:MAG: hypothetical protein OXE77_10030, partial [Flavobacteriaceae bacterium]|nr:hypothetical protein [Flavobacteriaceae bacterium]MCY4267256.1 hypothetical protein [Flavobacteriaceae bacterium]
DGSLKVISMGYATLIYNSPSFYLTIGFDPFVLVYGTQSATFQILSIQTNELFESTSRAESNNHPKVFQSSP